MVNSILVASSVAPVTSWDAARAALQRSHVSTVVLSEPQLAECRSWQGAVRNDVQSSVRWSEAEGLEADAEQRLADALLPLWPDGQAGALVPVFTRLADQFGRCLSEHGLLEEGDASVLRIRCALQASVLDFGSSERLFHRDHLPLRLLATLQGEGTVVLPDEALVSAREWRDACRAFDHDQGARLTRPTARPAPSYPHHPLPTHVRSAMPCH